MGLAWLGWASQVAMRGGEGDGGWRNPILAPSRSKRKVPTGLSTFKTGGSWGERGKDGAPPLSKLPNPGKYWPSGEGRDGSSGSQAPGGRSGLGRGLQGHTQPLTEVSIREEEEPRGAPEPRVLPPLRHRMAWAPGRAEEAARGILLQQTEHQLSHSTKSPPNLQACKLHKRLFESAHEPGRGPMSPGGEGRCLLLQAASPVPKPPPLAFNQRGLSWPPSPPPSHLWGAHVLAEPPPISNCPSLTQGLTAGRGGGVPLPLLLGPTPTELL